MKIAIEGCAHGELENIYKTIANIEQRDKIKVELLICCGDFQSTRNVADLQTMAVPNKFKDMGSFYKYYSGELTAPFLTIFIGGNHEASNYLQELPYGGWVAPNIYYLGYAGVIRVNGVRIAGISGIYKGHDFLRGRHEFAPYTQSTIRSVYHVRQLDVFRLKQLSGRVDIFLSHDWPRGVYNYGNKEQLIRFKPHFRDEIFSNQLGSRPCEDLLQTLKPARWFAAHLHCQFTATVPHYADENDDGDVGDGVEASEQPTHCTEFLALDKCLPRRRFLQIMDIETEHAQQQQQQLKLEYDEEWLAILYYTNHLISVKNSTYYMPGPRGGSDERYNFTPTPEEITCVRSKFNNDLSIPENFCQTVPAYEPKQSHQNFSLTPQPKAQINQQTTFFCDKLGIDDPLSLAMVIGGHELNHSSVLDASVASSSSLNESGASFTSDLNSSVNLWNISNCCSDNGSPSPRRLNISLNLPTPLKTQKSSSLFSMTPKVQNNDEIDVAINSDDDDDDVEDVDDAPLNADAESFSPATKALKRRNESIDSVAANEAAAATSTPAAIVDVVDEFASSKQPAAPSLNVVVAASSAESIKTPSQPKVFKRRNQNIYAEQTDESNENS